MKSDTRKLLDRLYNLRGNDSVVLFDIEQENKAAEETRASAEKEKKELEDSIDRLTKDSTVLEEQGERLKNILDALKEEDFSVIVNRLQLDFNPEEVSDKINRSLPGTIAALASEKKEAEIKLSEVESTMDSAITEIEELNIRRDEAIENQQKLNEFVELALTGNSNLTRDSITSLLAKFKFSKDEQRETAKLLMFPEDGLFEYEQKLAAGEKSGMSISDVFQEAKQEVNEDVQEKVEIIPEEPNRKYIAPDLIESTITPIDVVDDIETVEIKDEIDTYGIEIVKREYTNNGIDTESSSRNYISNNSQKVIEIINTLKQHKVTPILVAVSDVETRLCHCRQ